MDARRFDRLTLVVSDRLDRRRLVGLVAALAGGALAAPEAEAARCSGKKPCPPCQKCRKRKCRPSTDNAKCANGEVCSGGQCVGGAGCNGGPACAGNLTCCPGVGCVDTATDTQHCGGCGEDCGSGQTCSNSVCTGGGGTCGGPCPGDKECNQSTGFCACPAARPVQCEFNSTKCSADPQTDDTRCGFNCYDCAVSFAPGYHCCSGSCVNGCGPNTGGSCLDEPCGASCASCGPDGACCNLGSGTTGQCIPRTSLIDNKCPA